MGWGDREEVPNEAEGDARRAGEGPDGRDGGSPEGQAEPMEMLEDATDGALKYVVHMNAPGKTNNEIARSTIDYVKSLDVEVGGEMEAVMLGEDSAPLATYWGGLEELADKAEDVMVVGSDPRNSAMYGWELPLNVDTKPALRAVYMMNKKAKEADANAETLKLTLVTKPDQFHVGRGPGPGGRGTVCF